VIRFGQDYLTRDEAGAWALRSTFNLGIGALGATIRQNAADGRFFSWVGQVLRVQRIGGDRDSLAFLRFNFQLADRTLLSLNKFSVGGAQTVRGYRQNQNVGDNGIQASLELQFPIIKDDQENSIVKLHPFVEAGTVWNANGINPSPQTLFSLGLGATYQPIRNLIFRLDVGIPLINANNPGTNLQDSGIHFSINGNF
jgi:hemolysin activation/secretion protein